MKRHSRFWIVLLLTTVVWFLFAMSEEEEYPLQVRVEWEGVDTARYVVTRADTVLPLVFNSNCFTAISRYHTALHRSLVVRASGDTMVRVGSAFLTDACRDLGFAGFGSVVSGAETLVLTTAERCRRPYHPQLRDVDFLFAGQVGLAGDPAVLPDTVWLYGDSLSLQRIPELYTAPATVRDIADSGSYMLALAPVWRRFGDVRPSTDSVRVFVPAERQVEATVEVPVTFQSDDGAQQVRLYPDHVAVTLWVPVGDYEFVSEAHLEAVVRYDPAAPAAELPVYVTRFPARARIKSVSPSAISYVIIR